VVFEKFKHPRRGTWQVFLMEAAGWVGKYGQAAAGLAWDLPHGKKEPGRDAPARNKNKVGG